MATVTLIHQYATIQRIQLTQGEPFPMFLRGTCICEGTLCDHVLFTFNTTIPRDNYNWARVKGFREPKGKRDPGFDRLFESKFPTYTDVWTMTNIEVARHQKITDPRIVGCPSGHNANLCTENGVSDADCCSLPGQGSCMSVASDVNTTFIPIDSDWGSCSADGRGQYVCCNEGTESYKNGLYPEGHDPTKCRPTGCCHQTLSEQRCAEGFVLVRAPAQTTYHKCWPGNDGFACVPLAITS